MENEVNVVEQNGAEETPSTPTVEELMKQLAQEKATSAKYKSSIDKLTKNNGDLTKQLRERMSAEEQLAEEKAKKDAELENEMNELRNFKRMAEAKNRYMTIQKMDSETAEKMAQAEIDNDYNALSTIQQSYNEALLKAKEAEWLKSRPPINSGVDDKPVKTMSDKDFAKLSYAEVVKMRDENPELFKQYT